MLTSELKVSDLFSVFFDPSTQISAAHFISLHTATMDAVALRNAVLDFTDVGHAFVPSVVRT